MISPTWLKLLITTIAAIFIVIRLVLPDINIDAITVGLLIFGLLPWLSNLIESAKFPGGWEVKFRDLEMAARAITQGTTTTTSSSTTTTTPAPEPSYVSIATQDPNLALTGLRIEIEKRVRVIASQHGVQQTNSVRQALEQLKNAGVFDYRAIAGLDQIINAGNQAAHGANVEPRVAEWAIEYGPSVLKVLDNHIREPYKPMD